MPEPREGSNQRYTSQTTAPRSRMNTEETTQIFVNYQKNNKTNKQTKQNKTKH